MDVVQMYGRLNLMNNTLLDIAPYLRRRGVRTIINGSPLCMGLLRGSSGKRGNRAMPAPLPAWHPAPPPMREAARRMQLACAKRGRALPDVVSGAAIGGSRRVSAKPRGRAPLGFFAPVTFQKCDFYFGASVNQSYPQPDTHLSSTPSPQPAGGAIVCPQS